MSVYPYYRTNSAWYVSGAETALRTNSHGKDTANEAGDTFYGFPILLDPHPFVREQKNFVHTKGDNSRYTIKIPKVGYKPIRMMFTGPVYNHSLFMYFGTGICTTTDDTPSAGYYTHQCDSADTFPGTAPSFQLLHKMTNSTSGNSEWDLYVGCIVKSYKERADKDGIMIGTYEIEAARNITGVALSAEPSLTDGSRPLTLADAGVTWESYEYILDFYEFEYKNGHKLITGGGDYYSLFAIIGGVDFDIRMKYIAMQDDTYDDHQKDAADASSSDLTIKISRDPTTDYWEVKILDYFAEMTEEGFENRRLYETINFSKNPEDAGSSWDLTEVNDLTDDRYET